MLKTLTHLIASLAFTLVTVFYSTHSLALSDEEKREKLALIKQLKQNGDIVFAIVPKNTKIPFFKASGRGCEDAAKDLGVHCIFFGSNTDNAYSQLLDIKALIDAGVDGLAISQYVDGWLEKRMGQTLQDWGKPIISFDSPIHANFSKSYIGTDNYELGKQLGIKVRQLKPEGGTYCIHTERPDSPNHMLRLQGILDGLIQNAEDRHKWQNGKACPMFHHAQLEAGLEQMIRAIEWAKVDTYILTGGGPQFLLEPYQAVMERYRDAILTGKLTVASIDTTPNQLVHLKNGLSTINLGQQPYEMGTLSAQLLTDLHNGKTVKKQIYTGIIECQRLTVDSCTR